MSTGDTVIVATALRYLYEGIWPWRLVRYPGALTVVRTAAMLVSSRLMPVTKRTSYAALLLTGATTLMTFAAARPEPLPTVLSTSLKRPYASVVTGRPNTLMQPSRARDSLIGRIAATTVTPTLLPDGARVVLCRSPEAANGHEERMPLFTIAAVSTDAAPDELNVTVKVYVDR